MKAAFYINTWMGSRVVDRHLHKCIQVMSTNTTCKPFCSTITLTFSKSVPQAVWSLMGFSIGSLKDMLQHLACTYNIICIYVCVYIYICSTSPVPTQAFHKIIENILPAHPEDIFETSIWYQYMMHGVLICLSLSLSHSLLYVHICIERERERHRWVLLHSYDIHTYVSLHVSMNLNVQT